MAGPTFLSSRALIISGITRAREILFRIGVISVPPLPLPPRPPPPFQPDSTLSYSWWGGTDVSAAPALHPGSLGDGAE